MNTSSRRHLIEIIEGLEEYRELEIHRGVASKISDFTEDIIYLKTGLNLLLEYFGLEFKDEPAKRILVKKNKT